MSSFSLRGERPPVPPVSPAHQSPRHDSSSKAASPQPEGEGRSFAQVLAGIGEESKRGEAQVGAALGASRKGRDLSATELLTLQAGVYRYGEVVDLASRLVDRASTAVKTVIQGQ